MKKKFIITTEEFEAIKEAVSSALRLTDKGRGDISMSKKEFFESLEKEFIIED